ncbi:hypothetical protein TPB0596_04440 [Tsukamurella pulmonis]|uniref:helix-turn-helix domain-containing protein n=1 Tax=Tsukamurella pulmonis TaxID=47312 RepID=UPI001EDDD643|nr:helix-turn-helix transcriptional regulator [Tsukamurella pulmonis]BDD80681.1 hypothetical protein TPB0596_04440 [Tsukamurella pulmonis]
MSTPQQAALVSALQRAFAEAGNPSLTAVAESGVGVSRQRISDWRSGRHVPSRFSDLEPVIAYLQVAAAGANWAGAAPDGGLVTRWPTPRWYRVWEAAAAAGTPEPEPPPVRTSIEMEIPKIAPVDRRALALAVVTLLAVLVGAVAVAAYLLSAATM